MSTYTRRNAWNENGSFDNTDLLWYAKAVKQMMDRQLDDPTSWWFFAAIHGQNIIDDINSGDPPPNDLRNWARIQGPPHVPVTPLPSSGLRKKYWDQCQHGSWFFLPWHRGYLYAIENILRKIVKSLNGPDNWALPYWNYFGPDDQYKIPPAFTTKKLPDGTDNALYVNARYGPNNDGNIFIPLSAWGITQDCQRTTAYTGRQPEFYGGSTTGFAHAYGVHGSVEYDPHGAVHVATGGQYPNTEVRGLMGAADTAALDPVFYLHHCNIDRMWAAWNNAQNKNPDDPNWLNGPTATGDRLFYMPNPDKTDWLYTPAMLSDTAQLDYTYDDLSLGADPLSVNKNEMRLFNFGLGRNEIKFFREMAATSNPELVGANQGAISIDASGARTTVKLDSKGWSTVSKSLNRAAAANFKANLSAADLPDQVYLQLEGIKGNDDSVVCSVSVNQQYAGHITLFGLRNASAKDGHHAGSGLTIRLDISKIADSLQLNNDAALSSLDILIQPVNIVSKGNEVTVDRISVYRKGQL